jgi:thioredoxin-like negative regulator of GroEL
MTTDIKAVEAAQAELGTIQARANELRAFLRKHTVVNLTRLELLVAETAVEPGGVKELAARIRMRPKDFEMRLAAACRKLGVADRDGLAAALHALDGFR